MVLIAAATLAGLAVGLLLPRGPAHLARAQVNAWWLLAAGLVAQLAGRRVDGGAGTVLLLCAYGLLLAFGWVNVHHTGVGVVMVGLALNVVVIAANGGMPVHGPALVRAGIVPVDEIATVSLDGHRHLEDRGDRVTALDDRIPLAVADEVVSFGDLVLTVGLADVIAHLIRRRRRSGGPAAKDPPVIDLREPREKPQPGTIKTSKTGEPARLAGRG